MDYLTRPIFPFAIDWADQVNKSFTYDLKELALGFGAEIFQSLQQHVVQGYTLTTDLRGNPAIADFDQFTAALLGRLVGFWLPTPFEFATIAAVQSTTVFDIPTQGLADTWEDHPDIHLLFTPLSPTLSPTLSNSIPAKILSVTLLDPTTERITLDTEVPFLLTEPATRITIRRLHYVRLADDLEAGTFVTENWLRRTLKLIELPTEYTAAETGTQPLYLYHFWWEQPVDVHHRYTSFAADVVSANNLHTHFPISHGSLKSDLKADASTLDIDAAYDATHPFASFLPLPPGRPLRVEVHQVSYATPDTRTLLFTGLVRGIEDDGDRLTAHCDTIQAIFSRRLPRMLIQPDCGYQLYEPRTCKALRAKYETIAQITAIDNDALPPTITLSLLISTTARISPGYFDQGWIELGHRANFSIRTILASAYAASLLTLQLNAPLSAAAAQVGDVIALLPGCDGKWTTCRDKFHNKINFGGFVDVPNQNLSLQAINHSVTQGGKK